MKQEPKGFYCRYGKRILDIVCASAAMLIFCWLYAVLAILVRIKLGSPVIFRQARPGKDERIFYMYKFRSMTDARDEKGNLLPDEVRLTPFGKKLRAASLDELPELWNILKGDMSIVGPRPQLVRDMVYMTEEQRKRHTVRPGLTGWAQVNGRNALLWENKLNYDLEYLDRISFREDLKIICLTVRCLFVHDDVSADGMATAEDYGDYLLRIGAITEEAYREGHQEADSLLAHSR